MDWLDRITDGFFKAFIKPKVDSRMSELEERMRKARMKDLSDRELKFIAGEAGHLDMWAARRERADRFEEKWSKLK